MFQKFLPHVDILRERNLGDGSTVGGLVSILMMIVIVTSAIVLALSSDPEMHTSVEWANNKLFPLTFKCVAKGGCLMGQDYDVHHSFSTYCAKHVFDGDKNVDPKNTNTVLFSSGRRCTYIKEGEQTTVNVCFTSRSLDGLFVVYNVELDENNQTINDYGISTLSDMLNAAGGVTPMSDEIASGVYELMLVNTKNQTRYTPKEALKRIEWFSSLLQDEVSNKRANLSLCTSNTELMSKLDSDKNNTIQTSLKLQMPPNYIQVHCHTSVVLTRFLSQLGGLYSVFLAFFYFVFHFLRQRGLCSPNIKSTKTPDLDGMPHQYEEGEVVQQEQEQILPEK